MTRVTGSRCPGRHLVGAAGAPGPPRGSGAAVPGRRRGARRPRRRPASPPGEQARLGRRQACRRRRARHQADGAAPGSVTPRDRRAAARTARRHASSARGRAAAPPGRAPPAGARRRARRGTPRPVEAGGVAARRPHPRAGQRLLRARPAACGWRRLIRRSRAASSSCDSDRGPSAVRNGESPAPRSRRASRTARRSCRRSCREHRRRAAGRGRRRPAGPAAAHAPRCVRRARRRGRLRTGRRACPRTTSAPGTDDLRVCSSCSTPLEIAPAVGGGASSRAGRAAAR